MSNRYQNVLGYLGRMEMYALKLHRHDIASYYRDGWETAAAQIFGLLPPRDAISTNPLTQPRETKPPTPWRQQMLAKPLRRIIARVDEHEILECGHRFWTITIPGETPARRRRCPECANVASQEKKAAAAARPKAHEASA